MAINLIIEGGTMPDGANTYAGTEQLDAYLGNRGGDGLISEKTEDEKAAALIRAADVLNSYAWKGKTAEPGRVMAWPRSDMRWPDGTDLESDFIPKQLIDAQCELAGDILSNDSDPLAAVDTNTGAVVSERVDVIQVSYAEPGVSSYSGITGYPLIDALLKPFLGAGGGNLGVIEVQRG